jgi:2-oxoglutarate oxidoreductase, alpha subunit
MHQLRYGMPRWVYHRLSKKRGITMAEEKEILLMKGNEAIAHAAIRCGCDGYFGYPITPQSEVLETLAMLKPWETTGMVVLQAESEVASINMLYGGGGSGKRVMTSSSSPGVALMQEGIAYMAGAEVPGLIVNVQRGGPGLGTIQPSQSDYNQATRGGGNGDYHVIVLAPNSVQEMADFVDLGFELAFRYRNPAMILSDGVIGQMMEKVILPPLKPRRTDEQIYEECPWAANGHGLKKRGPNVITSLELEPAAMEKRNLHLQKKYAECEEKEVRFEEQYCEDADYIIVAFGSASRISQKAMDNMREQGLKVGLFRPITLWPFPSKELKRLSEKVKGMLVVEINAGMMVFDVQAAVEYNIPVQHFGRLGGIVPNPDEIVQAMEKLRKVAK